MVFSHFYVVSLNLFAESDWPWKPICSSESVKRLLTIQLTVNNHSLGHPLLMQACEQKAHVSRERETKWHSSWNDRIWACGAQSWKGKGTVKSWLSAYFYVHFNACTGRDFVSQRRRNESKRVLRKGRGYRSSWLQEGHSEGVLRLCPSTFDSAVAGSHNTFFTSLETSNIIWFSAFTAAEEFASWNVLQSATGCCFSPDSEALEFFSWKNNLVGKLMKIWSDVMQRTMLCKYSRLKQMGSPLHEGLLNISCSLLKE